MTIIIKKKKTKIFLEKTSAILLNILHNLWKYFIYLAYSEFTKSSQKVLKFRCL